MMSPSADSRLFSFLFRGFSRLSFKVSFLPVELFISSIFFVFEIIGITRSSRGLEFISLGFSLSTMLLLLNSSMVRSPPNTSNCSLNGAIVIDPSLLYNFLRMMIMLLHMIPPLVIPYLSMAYRFMQLHEQNPPHVWNLFLSSSYLYGNLSISPSNGWQHHQHHIV